MKILCVLGKYQYGDKSRGINTEYFSFVPAFEALGHEVVLFDSWDKSLYADHIELNQRLIETIGAEAPDIIFSAQFLYEVWTETWDYIRAHFACKTINWCSDDSWKFMEHSRFFADHFDVMVTTYEAFLPRYKKLGANAILSGWGVPIAWMGKPKLATECKYDVTFIGTAHGDRREKVEALRKKGIDVRCFGYGWEDGFIEMEDIPRVFRDSVISLNFANNSGENQIKARTFEVTGSGGFLLTEDAKDLERSFKDKREVVVFSSMADCAEKIHYYLAHTRLRDEIARDGYLKTSANYSYTKRVENVLSYASKTPKTTVDNDVNMDDVYRRHTRTRSLAILKALLVTIGTLFFGKKRGPKFARRIVYEFSWRFSGARTFRADGLVGRMFYDE